MSADNKCVSCLIDYTKHEVEVERAPKPTREEWRVWQDSFPRIHAAPYLIRGISYCTKHAKMILINEYKILEKEE